MLKKAALEFGRALADLARFQTVCEMTRRTKPELLHDQSGTMTLLLHQVLGNLKRVCILADLDDVLAEIDRFLPSVGNPPRIEDAQGRAAHLRERLIDELENEHYFQVRREDVRYYEQSMLFGEVVAKKFPRAREDIKRAGNCLALQEGTAAVFHLMRAMEVAVRQLARRPQMNITLTPKTTWRQITGAMDAKIAKMPDGTTREKNRKENWEASRANLHHVGSVWRNSTMHPAKTYTPSQARDVLDACRVFMSGLCAL